LPTPLPRETLTSRVVKALTHRIAGGALKPGSRLPTEQALIGEFAVSRTVVREAISSLKAAGLVSTHQGLGAFVLQAPREPPFRIDLDGRDLLNEVIAVLELRISIESEAASLAAQRRSERHLGRMRRALDRMAAAIEARRDAVDADLEFHRTVAEATGNAHFTHMFGYLGALLIPRTRLKTARYFAGDRAEYLRRVNREHEDIFQAIARREGEAARSAMRLHLSNSRERIRRALAKDGRG
jgi:DNA-binding FadR family transcriptional regulator